MLMNLLYIAAILILMIFSFLFSGSETGVYRISRFRLRLGVEQRRKSFILLSKMMEEGHNLILSLLLGNNLVNYVMTLLFTFLLLRHFQNEHLAELYTSLILTPVVFIFCEMIPKSIFYHKSDVLLPHLSVFLKGVFAFFRWTGLLKMFKYLFAAVIRLFKLNQNTVEAVDKTQRLQVFQIIHETQEEGLLSDVQKDMIHRLINIPDISIRTVMIPFADFDKISLQAGKMELTSMLRNGRFFPVLVYDQEPHHVLGTISLEEVLAQNEPYSVRNFITPLLHMEHSVTIIEAITVMRKNHEKIALIVETSKGKPHPIGVLRIADLIGQLTGGIKI